MGFDSRGILRGVCNHPSCNCKEFTKRETSAKCNCGHAPTAHIDVASGVAASGHPTYHGKDTVGLYSNVNIPSQGYVRQPSDPTQCTCHKCRSVYPAKCGACPVCFERDNCPCGNMNFYDQMYGPFSYCSPSCRDTHLLPVYNKKLQEDLEKNPLHNDGCSTAGGGFNSTVLYSPPVTGGADTRTPNSEVSTKQSTFAVQLPKFNSGVCFYKNVWSVGGKYGLYVTGLIIREDTGDLNLGDLIFGVGGNNFDSNTDYKDMMLKYNRGTHGRVYREHDFGQMCKNAKKEGSSTKCGAENEVVVFYLCKTEFSGIAFKAQDNQVVIMKVDEESIAERSGIQSNDIIRSIGNVNRYPKDDIEFTKVTKKEHVTSSLTKKSSVLDNGHVLIIERSKLSYI